MFICSIFLNSSGLRSEKKNIRQSCGSTVSNNIASAGSPRLRAWTQTSQRFVSQQKGSSQRSAKGLLKPKKSCGIFVQEIFIQFGMTPLYPNNFRWPLARFGSCFFSSGWNMLQNASRSWWNETNSNKPPRNSPRQACFNMPRKSQGNLRGANAEFAGTRPNASQVCRKVRVLRAACLAINCAALSAGK